ncbi:MAG: alpha-hydroxy acid oxidase [Myxococcota bacterium]|nr:alpha-hydroxy acid oxidase [Myxococcota bacterium]
MSQLLNLHDYEVAARSALDENALGYFASGADDQRTLEHNTGAWHELRLRPRAFVDVDTRDLSTTLLGQTVSMPLGIAPMAFQRMAHPDGELAVVRAAGDLGAIYCLSTISNTSVERVMEEARGEVWFQLYVDRVRSRAQDLVSRVEAAGCGALVVTVDTPLLGNRDADVRNGFTMPAGLELPNLPGHGGALRGEKSEPGSTLANFARDSLDASLTWKDLEAFAAGTRLPVIAKGVLRADDARRAVDHGAQAIIVSNHGGRQLDTAIPTAWALPEIIDAVGDQVEVYVDGGIRRGTDALKALALGARAVFVGRPVLWGLALDGEAGVDRVLSILRQELDLAMALAGCPDLAACTRDLLWGFED